MIGLISQYDFWKTGNSYNDKDCCKDYCVQDSIYCCEKCGAVLNALNIYHNEDTPISIWKCRTHHNDNGECILNQTH